MLKLNTICLAAVIGWGVAQASAGDYLNRNFQLANRTDHTITRVIASNVGDSTFDPIDLLGDDTIPPNNSLLVAPFDAQGWCRFDLRITFRNGDQQDVYNVNVCDVTRLTMYGDGNDGYARVSYN